MDSESPSMVMVVAMFILNSYSAVVVGGATDAPTGCGTPDPPRT